MAQGRLPSGFQERPDPAERIARKIEALRKVLGLERERGYSDSAVFGGVDRFLERWSEDPEVRRTLDDARVAIPSYTSLGVGERRAWVEAALARLAEPPPPPAPAGRAPEEGPSPAELRRGLPGPGAARPVGPRTPRPRAAPDRLSAPRPPTGPVSLDDDLPFPTPRAASLLRQVGIRTYRDALWSMPHRYVAVVPISGLLGGREQAIAAVIERAAPRQYGRGGLQATEALVADDSGAIRAVWFGRSYLARALRPGSRYLLTGRLSDFRSAVRFNVESQELLTGGDAVRLGDNLPVYPLTEGLTQRTARRAVSLAMASALPMVQDFLPGPVRVAAHLMELRPALRALHRPADEAEEQAARRRLAFDELLLLQLGLLERRRTRQAALGAPIPADRAALERLLTSLPFTLTAAQRRVLEEALADMARSTPMSRLLQGDVGSGKTVVAAACLLMAAARGFQGALMAPTEVLAEQHFKTLTALLGRGRRPPDEGGPYRGFQGLLEGRPLRIALLTGSMAGGAKESLHRLIAAGDVDIALGTHALIQEGVTFANLGLAVVDEQHRFGVEQRAALRQKGFAPHLLVMTATPIPRTLALTLYGDLDVSTIDELPPGRPAVQTRVLLPHQRAEAYADIRRQVSEGRQGFIICPLVEESPATEAKAAVAEHRRLSREVFPDLRVGLLHGRMRPQAKEEVMEMFHQGALDLLVSTAVVEVGIDVPNATVMLVEGAERFGLAQLHQYRGRVGRGPYPSTCILASDSAAPESRQRLELVASTRDGFALAEADLQLRGAGEFFGTRQSGLPDLRLAPLADLPLLEAAREQALRLEVEDPGLSRPEHHPLREEVARFWSRAAEAPISAA